PLTTSVHRSGPCGRYGYERRADPRRIRARAWKTRPRFDCRRSALMRGVPMRQDDPVRIGLLGAFEVQVDGTPVNLPGARSRALLAALALEAGKIVPKTRLVDWVWGEEPPADEANALQVLVSRLRKALPK
ncbi:hypothetical protein ADL26_15145, partial [Thermoactinomyces vulgaris]